MNTVNGKEKIMFKYPKVDGMAIVRYWSAMNRFIDFIVIVEEEKRDAAAECVSRAMEIYWESDDLCYGDCVEDLLAASSIDYEIVYHDAYDESYEYEEVWEEYLSGLCNKASSYIEAF